MIRTQQAGSDNRLRVIVLGLIVRFPLGGMAWHYLQYVIGLARRGHDVYFVEDSDDYESCYDPVKNVMSVDPTYGLQFTSEVFEEVGLGDRWAYYDAHTERWHGLAAEAMGVVCSTAELLLNVSGVTPLRPWLMSVPARALVDTDPAFMQIRNLAEPWNRERMSLHNAFLTFGENIGSHRCRVPDDGFPWQRTRQPIVLEAWPVMPGPIGGKFSTVMQWNSYPPREHEGVRYGMKSDSFKPYIDLPTRVDESFELALGSPSAPRDLLRRRGWSILDSRDPTWDPWVYQRYIQGSKAEFSVAKHGYVISRSGWFSERSAAYLASGRPVLLQETGFSDWLDSGAGIVPFSTLDQVLSGIEDINARYDFHSRAARDVAHEYFDADKVLSDLVERAVDLSTAPTSGAEDQGV
jgi:hypothetical protein